MDRIDPSPTLMYHFPFRALGEKVLASGAPVSRRRAATEMFLTGAADGGMRECPDLSLSLQARGDGRTTSALQVSRLNERAWDDG